MRTSFYAATVICALIGFAFVIVTLTVVFTAGGFIGGSIGGRPGTALDLIAAIGPAANAATIALALALVPLAVAIAFDRLGNP